MTIEINRDIAIKVLKTVDAGLSSGVGYPMPGRMCVEAAVCYALGLPHSDDPQCVSPALRSLKIWLNDSDWSSKMARAKGLRRLALAQLGSAGILDEQEFCRRVVDHAIRGSASQALRAAASVIKNPEHKAAMIAAISRCENEGTQAAAIEAKNAATAAHAIYTANITAIAGYAANAADAAANAAATYTAGGYGAAHRAAAIAAETAFVAAFVGYTTTYDAVAARDRSLSDYAEAIVQILIAMEAPGCKWLDLT